MKKTSELKKITLLYIILYLTVASAFAQQHGDSKSGNQPVLLIHKATCKITVDGKAVESCWVKAQTLTFNSFYNQQKSGDEQTTHFKMLWDDENVYTFFECGDKYITAREKTQDGQPYFDDCAELFLMPSASKINMHFGFELNLYKTVNDFIFLNNMYRDENLVIKAYNPNLKVAVKINGTVNDNSDIDKGWTLELAIPISAFHAVGPTEPIGIAEGISWSLMAVRQDRNDADGDRRTTSTLFPLQVEDKNVHDPQNFGTIKFVGN